jgi:hypothetical protein
MLVQSGSEGIAMNGRFWSCLALGFAPLMIYPFVLLANIMSLVAERPADASLPFAFLAFFWTSLAYPIVWICCAAGAVGYSNRDDYRIATRIAIVPLFYIAMVTALFCWWGHTTS